MWIGIRHKEAPEFKEHGIWTHTETSNMKAYGLQSLAFVLINPLEFQTLSESWHQLYNISLLYLCKLPTKNSRPNTGCKQRWMLTYFGHGCQHICQKKVGKWYRLHTRETFSKTDKPYKYLIRTYLLLSLSPLNSWWCFLCTVCVSSRTSKDAMGCIS